MSICMIVIIKHSDDVSHYKTAHLFIDLKNLLSFSPSKIFFPFMIINLLFGTQATEKGITWQDFNFIPY